jgi:uncharacterized phage protein (TIGR01671 family)
MREIKFRAWDIDNEVFVYSDDKKHCFTVTNYGFSIYLIDESDMIELHTDASEQFTGLHDKNDKEIYEWDIVSHDDDFKHSGVVQFSKGLFGINWDYSKNIDPGWNKGRLFGVWGNEHNLRKMGDGFNREILVIGNRHIYPELINNGEMK